MSSPQVSENMFPTFPRCPRSTRDECGIMRPPLLSIRSISMASPVASVSASNTGRRRVILWSTVFFIVGLLIGHIVTHHWMHQRQAGFSTPYQAVLLSNGAVYYGKLSGFGSRTPVLNDVYYIVS